jgi:hypothetical protein
MPRAITSSAHSWAGPGWVASAGALRPRNARAIVPQPASQKYRERAAFPLLNFEQASLTSHASDRERSTLSRTSRPCYGYNSHAALKALHTSRNRNRATLPGVVHSRRRLRRTNRVRSALTRPSVMSGDPGDETASSFALSRYVKHSRNTRSRPRTFLCPGHLRPTASREASNKFIKAFNQWRSRY